MVLGIAMGLERAAAICVRLLHRHQEQLTGEFAEALTAAERISAEGQEWREASEEHTPIGMPSPRRRALQIVGVAH